jgi:hypothetical protein
MRSDKTGEFGDLDSPGRQAQVSPLARDAAKS